MYTGLRGTTCLRYSIKNNVVYHNSPSFRLSVLKFKIVYAFWLNYSVLKMVRYSKSPQALNQIFRNCIRVFIWLHTAHRSIRHSDLSGDRKHVKKIKEKSTTIKKKLWCCHRNLSSFENISELTTQSFSALVVKNIFL